MNRPTLLTGVLVIIVVGVAAYLNSLGGALFWDDEITVINNVFIRSPHFLRDVFLSSYHSGGGETVSFYRPLATVSFMLDYHLWRLDSFGYHLTNILLHVANALLLFWLVQALFKDAWGTGLITALFFVVHPVNSEAVNYISNRTDLMMFFFLLCSFSLYLLYRERGKPILLVLSIIGYAGSILSKEMGLVLPLLFFPADSLRNRSTPIRSLWGYLAVFIVYVTLRATVLNFLHLNFLTQGAQAEPFSSDVVVRFLTFAKAHVTYVRLFFLPVNLHMEYDNPNVGSRLDPEGWLAAALLGAMGCAVWLLGRRDPRIRFGGAWYFLGLLPVCGIVPINNVLGEHYLYLASGGFFLVLASLLLRAFEAQPRKIPAAAAFAGIVVLLGGITVERNQDWANPLAMYLDIAHHTKRSFRANNNAGVEFFRRGNKEKADLYFKRALLILPTYSEALNNRGVIEEEKGNLAEALKLYQEALRSRPDYPLARRNLAKIFIKTGRLPEARDQLLWVLQYYPHDVEAQGLLTVVKSGK